MHFHALYMDWIAEESSCFFESFSIKTALLTYREQQSVYFVSPFAKFRVVSLVKNALFLRIRQEKSMKSHHGESFRPRRDLTEMEARG